MRRSSVALLLALCSTILSAACSDNTAGSPAATAPSELVANISPSAVSAACNYATITTAAQSYFKHATDPVFPLIVSMQASSADGLQAATNASWPITRIVASARLTSRVTTAAAGRTFLGALFACTNLIGNAASTDVVLQEEAAEYADFIGNAALILQQGLFAVRDGSSNAPAAALLSVVADTRTFALPRWGIEATGGTWPAPATGVAYLVYGYPTVNAVTQVTPASAINSNNGGIPSAFNAFALGSLPKAQPKLPLLVSICSPATGSASANRLVHSISIQVNESATQLCGTSYLASLDMPAGPSSLHGVGAYLASLISPRPLYAQTDVLSIGGHVSDWSPFTTATLTSSNLSISFETQPINSDVSTPEPIDVLVASNGLGVPGVSVTLNLLNNSGLPAGAGFTPDTAVKTDANGVAHFVVTFNKPGGYTVTATGVLSPVSITSASSNLFNIKH